MLDCERNLFWVDYGVNLSEISRAQFFNGLCGIIGIGGKKGALVPPSTILLRQQTTTCVQRLKVKVREVRNVQHIDKHRRCSIQRGTPGGRNTNHVPSNCYTFKYIILKPK